MTESRLRRDKAAGKQTQTDQPLNFILKSIKVKDKLLRLFNVTCCQEQANRLVRKTSLTSRLGGSELTFPSKEERTVDYQTELRRAVASSYTSIRNQYRSRRIAALKSSLRQIVNLRPKVGSTLQSNLVVVHRLA